MQFLNKALVAVFFLALAGCSGCSTTEPADPNRAYAALRDAEAAACESSVAYQHFLAAVNLYNERQYSESISRSKAAISECQ